MALFGTITTGFFIFILGRFFEKFVLDPWKDQRQAIGEVYQAIMFYANVYANPTNITDDSSASESDRAKIRETSKALRGASTKLLGTTYAVYFYPVFSFIFNAPTRYDISQVCGNLVDLSGNLTFKNKEENDVKNKNIYYRDEIIKLLRLESFGEKLAKNKSKPINPKNSAV